MKIMTINTHSLAEPDFEQKREQFVQVLLREKPDILALQEVNQTIASPVLGGACGLETGAVPGYRPCPGVEIPLRQDNYAAWLADRLAGEGLSYEWSWMPAKVGYGIYDEGMAIFSRAPIEEAEQLQISRSSDYQYWKTRKVLGIRTKGEETSWYYSVHMGWWDDEEEPFERQWRTLDRHLQEKRAAGAGVWLLGDFNSPAEVRGQGYDLVCGDGWLDTYVLAEKRDDGITVSKVIDGWRERSSKKEAGSGMRLDYIFSSERRQVLSSGVICSGTREPQVSDHYGVTIELREAIIEH